MEDRVLTILLLIILGWFGGFHHHYLATKDLTFKDNMIRTEYIITKRILEREILNYHTLVDLQEDIVKTEIKRRLQSENCI